MATGFSGCLLFTDDINTRPHVTVSAESQTRGYRREEVVVSATVTDAESPDRVELKWASADGPCASISANVWRARSWISAPQFSFTVTKVGPTCVRVIATDRHGASDTDEVDILGLNRRPEAVIDVETDGPLAAATAPEAVRRVPLYADVRLSGAQSRDGDLEDALKFTWSLVSPDGKTSEPPACAGSLRPEATRCFRASAPGAYRLTLTLTDRTETDIEPLTLQVDDDAAPCLKETNPPVGLPVVVVPRVEGQTFEVLRVDDDGEGFPGGKLGDPLFIWSAGPLGEVPVRLGGNVPRWPVSEALFRPGRPGDPFQVRVEVWDRASEEKIRQQRAALPCAPEEGICRVGECVRWITWRVQFSP